MKKSNKVVRYFGNLFRVFGWKLEYGGNLKIARKQLFWKKPQIEIMNNGFIKIGALTSNRGKQFFICDGGKLSIGRGCFFNDGCSITCMKELVIGDSCTFANNVIIVDHDHDFRNAQKGKYKTSPVFIGNNVWIGANSVVLRGAVIGDNCVVAAGTIVPKGNYPANSIIKNEKRISINTII